MAFTQPLDIAGRACQHLGVDVITLNDFNGNPFATKEGRNLNSCYDKLRLAEIQRNLWKFSTRRVVLRAVGVDSVLWTPPAWVSGSNYSLGTVVSYTPTIGPYTGLAANWQLAVAESSSTTTPDTDPNWHHYTGPLAIDLYNTGAQGTSSSSALNDGEVYQSGEVVLVPATYSAGTTYSINQVVNDSGSWYVSLVNSNIGNTPHLSPTDWALWTNIGRGQGTYGQTATKSPIPLSYPGAFSVFISLYNNNADNPVNSTANWLSLGGTIVPLLIAWPIGTGPFTDTSTLNAFYLPNGWLKRAPTDPKGGQMGFLGANSGVSPEDWVFEGPFLITSDAGPLLVRGVYDITDVSAFDPMFCEGVALRMAMATCEIITQKPELKKELNGEYKLVMGEARAVNSIEIGPISPVENRYVTVRV